MAQVAVMVQQRNPPEGGTNQHALTPAPMSPANANFITSSVRKRKEPREEDTHGEKRPCLGSPAPVPAQQQQQPRQPVVNVAAEVTAATGSGDGDLFSPSFHLLETTRDAAAAAEKEQLPATPAADNASTDASTGTSASLDQGEDSDNPPCRAALPKPQQSPAAVAVAAAPPQDEEEEDDWEFDPFLFIKRLPALHECIEPRTTFLLPRQTRHSKRKTLVLDLDETLVHSTLDGNCVPDFTFAVHMGTVRHTVAVRMRPFLHVFLKRVAELFEVVVFTASQQIYAEQLLDIVDPQKRLVKHRIYRDSCLLWEGNYLKDLTVLGRDLAHTLIVDNSPQAFGFQLENGVPIESWYDDDDDSELLKLLPFLEEVAKAEDVRPLIDTRYRLKDLVDATPIPPAVDIDNEDGAVGA